MKKKKNKRHHAHLDEYEDEEDIPRKRLTKEEDVEEYVLLCTLSGYVSYVMTIVALII